MALVMDLPPSRGWGERYEVNTVHFEPLQILMGENPGQEPLEGVGPENRVFFGPRMAMSETHGHNNY